MEYLGWRRREGCRRAGGREQRFPPPHSIAPIWAEPRKVLQFFRLFLFDVEPGAELQDAQQPAALTLRAQTGVT